MKTVLLIITSLTIGWTSFSDHPNVDEAGYTLVERLAPDADLNVQLNEEFDQTVTVSVVEKSDEFFFKVESLDHSQQTLIKATAEQVISKKIPDCKCLINYRFRNFGDPIWYKCGVCGNYPPIGPE